MTKEAALELFLVASSHAANILSAYQTAKQENRDLTADEVATIKGSALAANARLGGALAAME